MLRIRWYLVAVVAATGCALIAAALVVGTTAAGHAGPVAAPDWGGVSGAAHEAEVSRAGNGTASSRAAAIVPRTAGDGVFGRGLPDGTRLTIDRFGHPATVVAVTVRAGVMQIPQDPAVLGWWSGGAPLGSASGRAVVVGHVNWGGVSGPLSRLPDVRSGDRVTVGAGSSSLHYRIEAVHSYAKATGIPASVFDPTGPTGLVLITCGGPFDPVSGNYLDNVVAYAVASS